MSRCPRTTTATAAPISPCSVRPPASWYVALSSTGFASVSVFQWGLPGDVPVPGDFDADHRADITVYRPSTGVWYILYSASNYSTSFALQWGALGDVPVAADFSGDGFDDPTVYRASDATFWTYNPVSNAGLQSAAGHAGRHRPRSSGRGARWSRPRISTATCGRTCSVFRPSNGTWFIRHSSLRLCDHAVDPVGAAGRQGGGG